VIQMRLINVGFDVQPIQDENGEPGKILFVQDPQSGIMIELPLNKTAVETLRGKLSDVDIEIASVVPFNGIRN